MKAPPPSDRRRRSPQTTAPWKARSRARECRVATSSRARSSRGSQHGSPNRLAISWHFAQSTVEHYEDPVGDVQQLIEVRGVIQNRHPGITGAPQSAVDFKAGRYIEAPRRI